MIKTLRNVVTNVVSLNYDPEWTYIEALIKGNKKTTTYTFYRKLTDAKYISSLFEEHDIVVDWGDGIINSLSTHKYFSDKSGKDTRVVIKIKNIYNALRYNRAADIDMTLNGFLDLSNTVGALSVARPNNDSLEQLSLKALFKDCPIDHIDSRCFNNCSDIWDFSDIFQSTKISKIPENLFLPCTGANTVSYAFAYAWTLKKFPISLFDNCRKLCYPNCFSSVFVPNNKADLFRFEVDLLKDYDDSISYTSSLSEVNSALSRFFVERIKKNNA